MKAGKVPFTDYEIAVIAHHVLDYGIDWPPSEGLIVEKDAGLSKIIARHSARSVEAKWGDIRSWLCPHLAVKRGVTEQVLRVLIDLDIID